MSILDSVHIAPNFLTPYPAGSPEQKEYEEDLMRFSVKLMGMACLPVEGFAELFAHALTTEDK